MTLDMAASTYTNKEFGTSMLPCSTGTAPFTSWYYEESWYPLFQKGNPQLRVFLPNFWMKVVKDPMNRTVLPNRVTFIVHMDMTKYDISNYLQKIYNVSVLDVRTQIKGGLTKEVGPKKWVVKEDDYKMAFVTLGDGQTFQFPELYPEEKLQEATESDKKHMEAMKESSNKLKKTTVTKPGLPGWFA